MERELWSRQVVGAMGGAVRVTGDGKGKNTERDKR